MGKQAEVFEYILLWTECLGYLRPALPAITFVRTRARLRLYIVSTLFHLK
jgi:hypothetical protein